MVQSMSRYLIPDYPLSWPSNVNKISECRKQQIPELERARKVPPRQMKIRCPPGLSVIISSLATLVIILHQVNIQDRDLERDRDLPGDFLLTSSRLSFSFLSSTVESVNNFLSFNFFVCSKRIN